MNIANCNSRVPENIAAIIAQKGLKQCSIAKKARLTPQALNDMLNGRKIIKARDILAMASALEVTPNDIFGIPSPQNIPDQTA